MKRFFFLLLSVAALPVAADSASQELRTAYYNSFDPAQKPWNPGQALNIEEVFKNYRYYEIQSDSDGRLTVTLYSQGQRQSSEHYRLQPDGALHKE
ncbi:MAG: hypothetical protein ACYC2R_13645 [Burkholderiales bacterium]|nr:hypothetical protein [Sulfuricellaceae bacterium]